MCIDYLKINLMILKENLFYKIFKQLTIWDENRLQFLTSFIVIRIKFINK